MNQLRGSGHILTVDDDRNDVEMTLGALEGHGLDGRIDVVSHGGMALDYLYCRGNFQGRATGDPILVLLDNKMPKVTKR